MADTNYYGDKPLSLPRLAYRRLAKGVQETPDRRAELLAAAAAELNGAPGDLRKMKFVLPDYLRRLLTAEEAANLEAGIAARHAQAQRLKMAFPHASDEFSLKSEFLGTVLDLSGGPSLRGGGRFFTIGSCFARNIAKYLTSRGYEAQAFQMAEDLNSPISNAVILDLLQRPEAERGGLIADWVGRLFPEADAAQHSAAAEGLLRQIGELAVSLATADCVVMTLGNLVDFFSADGDASQPLLERVFPKFVAVTAIENLESAANAAARLKRLGAVLRLATHDEAEEAIGLCVAGVRSVTSAPLVITLSPVPVDNVMGLAGPLRSAIEIDAVSKGRLRSALDEAWPALEAAHAPLAYYPSFEIVRWIAPMVTTPIFGREDGAARHVSASILDAVCGLFVDRFVAWTPDAAAPEPARVLDAT
ncbi:GSCFA domain-containing protein [Phenylobacterium sp.]|uniref:GSCFA domain-containing protein n=1 Tax=Phenylobacterium sp. TaxID=1871053 RepID=UPI001223A721|nr:GSCFA domain-containing protein [Phenylobacterium sp.]THD62163.1 MAG: hypothetical protein E8A49_07785 [Phenylobacterium sp.]